MALQRNCPAPASGAGRGVGAPRGDLTVDSAVDTVVTLVPLLATSAVVPTTSLVTAKLTP